jgi:putative ABC transport system permease protein
MKWTTDIRDEFARLGKQVDDSVIDEFAQHAAAAYEARRADGESAIAAAARVRTLIEAWCAGTTGPRRLARLPTLAMPAAGSSPLAGLVLDVRLALRLLRRQPGFAILSITLIALAIASTTSLFSIVNGVVLRPLPRVNMDGLVRVFETSHIAPAGTSVTNVTYYAWRDAPATIAGLAVWENEVLSHDGPSGLELVRAATITANLFPLIGVAPALGSHFTEAQEISRDAVILSHGFWRERFGGAPDVIGQRLTLGGTPRTIAGVMPNGFAFPDRETGVWLPERPPTVLTREGRNAFSIAWSVHNGLARLKPGVTLDQASAEAAARVTATGDGMPGRPRPGAPPREPPRIVLTPMLDWMIKDVKPALWILSAAVALLFVAAIGNVVNMQLARAATRQRDVAIHSAIGASAGRLVSQLLVETSVIAAIGGAAGLAIAVSILRVLPALMPEDFPRLDDIALDVRVFAVAIGLTVAVAFLTCLLPARLARRVKLTSALAEDGAAPVGHSLRSPAARSRALIITGQVAIAALLLVGAGLLAQSLYKIINVDRGYEPASLLTARLTHVSLDRIGAARTKFYEDIVTGMRAKPGVTEVALTNLLPLTPSAAFQGQIPGSNPSNPGLPMEGDLLTVDVDYFRAMGMRIVRGRGFNSGDSPTADLAIVVNETFAHRYLPTEPLGTPIWLEHDAKRGCTPTKAKASACANYWRVVGVVADVRQSGIEAPVRPEIYAARSQMMSPPPATQYVVVRTTGDPAALAADLRALVKSASPTGVLEQVMTMEARLMTSLARPRLYATLVGGFAGFALLIAVIGLFGGLSYSVAQRTREIGVRTALGATRGHIMRLVLKQGTWMTAAGLILGFGAAAATVRYLAQFLFGVTPFDPITFAAAGALLLLVALVACAVPARRAANIDAIIALRR